MLWTVFVVLLVLFVAYSCGLGAASPANPPPLAATIVPTRTLTPPIVEQSQPPIAAATRELASTYSSPPSLSDISFAMSRTVERANTGTHFSAFGNPVSVTDGAGGLLTAVVGVRFPTADAFGRLVFFWHGASFLGWNSIYESSTVAVEAAGPATFLLTYPHFASNDSACCPSLTPVRIHYKWTGTALVPDGEPPRGLGNPVAVQMLP